MARYRVKPGDTPLKLAKQYNLSPDQILKTNKINSLSKGQVIKLPSQPLVSPLAGIAGGNKPPSGQTYGMPRVNYEPLRGQTYGMPIPRISQYTPGEVLSQAGSSLLKGVKQEAITANRLSYDQNRPYPYLMGANPAQKLLGSIGQAAQNAVYGNTTPTNMFATPQSGLGRGSGMEFSNLGLRQQYYMDLNLQASQQLSTGNWPETMALTAANSIGVTKDLLGQGYTVQNGVLVAPPGLVGQAGQAGTQGPPNILGEGGLPAEKRIYSKMVRSENARNRAKRKEKGGGETWEISMARGEYASGQSSAPAQPQLAPTYASGLVYWNI